MAQTVANLSDVLKEVWTSDRLEKQFLDANPFLDAIEKGQFEVQASRIGEKAIVPIHKGRSGGYTSVSSAGGSLNPPDEQKVDTAEYTLTYHWFQIALETGALNQAASSNGSAIVAKDFEIKGAISDNRKQQMRQIVTNSDGIIAACSTGGASTTVGIAADSATNYGRQALKRGWLPVGQKIDIGATSNTDSIVAGAEITAVAADRTSITIDSSVSTTAGTDFVYIANPNSGTAANPELNGLRSMFGSTTSALGGLDPDTAGEEWWRPATVDTTTTTMSLDLLLNLQLEAAQVGGEAPDYLLTSLKQRSNFYSLLSNQVRYSGEAAMSAGNVEGVTWNGMKINALPDVLDTDVFLLDMSALIRVYGQGLPGPTWASDIEGAGGRLRWVQGATSFQDAVVHAWQLGATKRFTSASAIGLTA